MYFYDTCSLLNNYKQIFKDVPFERFYISNITFKELENIKTSGHKDNNIKYRAKKVAQLLLDYIGMYDVVNYQKDWDDTYIEPNPLLFLNDDNRIIISALIQEEKDPELIFVTNDINAINTARSLGLSVLKPQHYDKGYTGYKTLTAFSEDELTNLYDDIFNGSTFDLIENQYLLLNQDNKIVDSYVLRDGKLERITQYYTFSSKVFGDIKPLDKYQLIAMDSMLNNQVTMIRGGGGCGKSLLALSYLFNMLEKGVIDKIIIFCNTVATAGSAKLGYYPGTREEKLLDSQIGNFLSSKLGDRHQVERMIDEGSLVLLPLSDIRGYDTTDMNAGIYITEAQNMDISMLKLALQRTGENTKFIIEGDPEAQVDLPQYAGDNNGMRRMSKVFRGKHLYGEVTLPIIHRSEIAEIAEGM